MKVVLPLFNGVSLSKIEIEQNGDVHVEFDLPTLPEQQSVHYRTDVVGKRTFDVYKDAELHSAAQALFKLLRRRLDEPEPERLGVSCSQCSESRCCRDYEVFLSQRDAEALATHLGLPLAELRDRHLEALPDWSGDFPYQLAKEDDHLGAKCTFLRRHAESGTMRCSIYEARPFLCRDFEERDCTLFDEGGKRLDSE